MKMRGYMKNRGIFGAVIVAMSAMVVCGCGRKGLEDAGNVEFIQGARLEEEQRTLSPGEVIHLKGTGYRETDDVMLCFTWETGERLIPVGMVSGVRAKKREVSDNGIVAVLPYRYPAADVEVSVMREGGMQKVGALRITDGQPPKDMRLYGVSGTGTEINGYIIDENNVCRECLDIALPESLHSVVNVPKSYGICGIAGEGDDRTAVNVDFFTGSTETLASGVMALILTPAKTVVAVVCHEDVCALKTLPVEVCADYMTKSEMPTPVQPTFTLPDGLKPEYFGSYPGIAVEAGESCSYLLSANMGGGKWATVMLSKDGFRKIEELEAAGVIPFRAGGEAGYVVTYDGGPSLFRPVNAETGEMGHEVYTFKMGRILSATSNMGNPGHVLINLAEPTNGTCLYDLDWKSKTTSPFRLPNRTSGYAEVLMAN